MSGAPLCGAPDIPTLDYRLLDRWRNGRFIHERIAGSDPIRGEAAPGWLAHYAISVTLASLPLAIWGPAAVDGADE